MNKWWASLFILPLFFSGCLWDSQQNLDIAQIDQQADDLRAHLYKISEGDDYYKNENIDFALLNRIQTVVNERGESLISSYKDGKIDEAKKEEGLKKVISLLYFIWMEKFDAAQADKNVDEMEKIFEEQEEFSSNQTIKDYLANNGKIDNFNKLQDVFKNYPDLIKKNIEIDDNNKKLEQLKSDAAKYENENNINEYNRVADEFNALLETNNNLVEEYNTKLEKYNYEDIYKTFMGMIDAEVIFPGQTDIPLQNYKNESNT